MVRIVGNYVYEVYMVYMHDAIKFYIMLWKFIKMLNVVVCVWYGNTDRCTFIPYLFLLFFLNENY